MILSGEKKAEYRELTPYYKSRFKQRQMKIRLRNGYAKHDPTIECLVSIRIDYGNPNWGAEPMKLYYVLQILEFKGINYGTRTING